MTELVKKQNGGKRPGAGRKKASHTIKAEKAREYIINRIATELEPILTAQIEAAKGIFYADPKAGLIYKKLPDTKAGEYLINQSAGKPKESMDLKVTDDNADLTPLDPKMAEEKKKLLEQYHTGLKQIYAKGRKNK